MEWLNGPTESENMEVDIGYMPLMQVNISAPSRIWRFPSDIESPMDIDSSVLDIVQNIKWSKEIEQEEAFRELEVKMYPFKQVSILLYFLIELFISQHTAVMSPSKKIHVYYFGKNIIRFIFLNTPLSKNRAKCV